MVNLEVYGGLVSALSRGNSWYDAMMSLYNAGYSKKDIEEAAGILKTQIVGKKNAPNVDSEETGNPPHMSPPNLKPAFKSKPSVDLKPSVNPEQKAPETSKETGQSELPHKTPHYQKQIVSSYGSPKKTTMKRPMPVNTRKEANSLQPPMSKGASSYPNSSKKPRSLVVILVILLIIMLGVLAGLFLFRDKIYELLGSFGF